VLAISESRLAGGEAEERAAATCGAELADSCFDIAAREQAVCERQRLLVGATPPGKDATRPDGRGG
jgi:hypothetical protein